MHKRFGREKILGRLKKTVKNGKPVIGAGCSAGIIAKCAEAGETDLIIVYSTGKSRLMGLPTTIMGDSNAITLSMAGEILNVVKDTPVIAGIDVGDPTHMDLSLLLEEFIDASYSGIINFPTIGVYGDKYRIERETVGLGFPRELEMVKTAKGMDLFTMAYVFSKEDAQAMAEAGVDCMVPHVGMTGGGMEGFKKATPLKTAADTIQGMIEVTKEVNPEIICLSHGGAVATPEDTQYIYEHTDAVGYVGASSIERIPIEQAVTEVVSRFKKIPIRRK